jgi:hypothetical protein
MSEIAQIILAVGSALALVLFAANGPLATVLNRGSDNRLPNVQGGLSRREWWMVAIACSSAVSAFLTLLGRVL